MKKLALILASSAALLAACDSAEDRAEDKFEADAKASAIASGNTAAALGLTEAQLLNADLYGASKVELGDVARVLRNSQGEVDRLVVEIEDSNPDKYVEVPISGLTTIKRGGDIDLSSEMTLEQFSALPAYDIAQP